MLSFDGTNMNKSTSFYLPDPDKGIVNPGRYLKYGWDKWEYDQNGECKFSYNNKNGGLSNVVWELRSYNESFTGAEDDKLCALNFYFEA